MLWDEMICASILFDFSAPDSGPIENTNAGCLRMDSFDLEKWDREGTKPDSKEKGLKQPSLKSLIFLEPMRRLELLTC